MRLFLMSYYDGRERYHFYGFVFDEIGELIVADETGSRVEPLHHEDVPILR